MSNVESQLVLQLWFNMYVICTGVDASVHLYLVGMRLCNIQDNEVLFISVTFVREIISKGYDKNDDDGDNILIKLKGKKILKMMVFLRANNNKDDDDNDNDGDNIFMKLGL